MLEYTNIFQRKENEIRFQTYEYKCSYNNAKLLKCN